MSKNLNLVLKEKYYNITGEPGKMWELRKPTDWIISRLTNKDGTMKNYDFVELCNAYKKGRETKLRKFITVSFLMHNGFIILPSGEKLEHETGDLLIILG